MNYTVSLITTKPDCEALINIAKAEKDGHVYRKTGLERQHLSATSSAQEIAAEIASLEIELAALQNVIDNLPEGPTKKDAIVKFHRSDFKKFNLEQRRDNYGTLALLEKEYDIACMQKNIEESDALLTALNDRMNNI